MYVSLGHSSKIDHFPPSTWDDHRTKNCHFLSDNRPPFSAQDLIFLTNNICSVSQIFSWQEDDILAGSGYLEILIHFLLCGCTSFSEYELTVFDKEPLFCVHEFFCRWREVEILTRLGYQKSKGTVYMLAYL